ncbi:MAG: ABC transporter permease [Cyclobacteriaceae bacterium]
MERCAEDRVGRRRDMIPSPPDWMTRFLRWYCRKDLVDGIEGDLHELYLRRVEKYGHRKSNLLYFLNTLLFFQPFAFKEKNQNRKLNFIDMLRNYFRIAVRSLLKTKSISTINILGLAIGISSFIMMIAYVFGELSYDKFNSKADRILRVTYSYETRGENRAVSRVAFPLKQRLLENYPEVERVTRFYQNRMDATTLKAGQNLFTEEKIFFADPEVFEVFDFPLLSGNPSTALKSMNSIVLTKEAALKYFGDSDPMGKTILYKNRDKLEVTGILEKPTHSHIDFEFLVPVELQRQRWKRESGNNGYDFEQDWKWSGAWTYILLDHPSSKEAFDTRILEDGKDLFGRVSKTRVEYNFATQPLLDIHLKSDMISEIGINGNLKQVYGFAIVAFLILLIACINFINLMTAQSTNRAKEIGLRKVMGAHRTSLVWQFITESVLVTLLATLLSLLLLEVIVPVFNSFMNQSVSIPYFQLPILILGILAGAVIVGALAGSYPSFYLSNLKPIVTLRGNYSGESGNARLKKIFVIVQFTVSNILVVGIIVVQMQMNFVKGKNLGFDKDQTIVLEHGTKIDDEFELFRSRLINNTSISGIYKGYIPGTGGWQQSFNIDGEEVKEAKSLGFKNVGYEFLDLFQLEMAAGRNFSREFATDSSQAILINEATVRALGWSNEEALGKDFSWIGGNDNKTKFSTKVIGVMKDANFESLYQPVRPSVFKLNFFGDVAIKFDVSSMEELLASVESVEEIWNETSPQWPFEFAFLDRQIEDQYKKDERLGQMIQFFAFLAIFIACMGLFGLATFTVKKRTKEIGVRKVLGAGVSTIVFVIMKGFVILVTISFLISVPLAYHVSNSWLQNFEYRIELGPLVFIAAGVVSLVVAGLAILSQSLNAATTNPVNILKDE